MINRDIIIEPIGVIHTPFTINDILPRQGRFSEETEGYVELESKYIEGLLDLVTFTHIILLNFLAQI